MNRFERGFVFLLVAGSNRAGWSPWVEQREKHYSASFLHKPISHASQSKSIVGSMGEPTLLPGKLPIALKKIKHIRDFILLCCGVHQELLITERAATHGTFPLWNHEHIRFAFFLFTGPDKAHSLVAVEGYSDSDLTLELVALDDTFDAVDDRPEDTMLHHGHAELNKYDDLDDVCPFLHVELIGYSEIQNTLSRYLCAGDVYLINGFVYLESQAAKVASRRAPSAVELEVWVYVPLAAGASQRSTRLHDAYLLAGERSHPQGDGHR